MMYILQQHNVQRESERECVREIRRRRRRNESLT